MPGPVIDADGAVEVPGGGLGLGTLFQQLAAVRRKRAAAAYAASFLAGQARRKASAGKGSGNEARPVMLEWTRDQEAMSDDVFQRQYRMPRRLFYGILRRIEGDLFKGTPQFKTATVTREHNVPTYGTFFDVEFDFAHGFLYVCGVHLVG